MQSGKSPNTRPQGERFQNEGLGRGRSTGFGGKGTFFYPLTKPRSKGRFPGKAGGSVTLDLRLRFLWGSGRGSNAKLLNEIISLFPSWI